MRRLRDNARTDLERKTSVALVKGRVERKRREERGKEKDKEEENMENYYFYYL